MPNVHDAPDQPVDVPTVAFDLPARLGLDHPLVNAPMAGAAGGALAGAVSTAGGLGLIGIASTATKEWISEQATLARAPGRAWGAGLMAWVLERSLDPLHEILDHGPSLVSVSFGDPGPAAALIRESGALCAMQVGNDADLQRALEPDIDVVVCRGGEGGGHGRNDVATLPLLQQALAATSKPVIAAGGIADARGVAAVLAAGAQAAWIGTRFAASTESSSHDRVKQAIAAAELDDTIFTRVFDIAQRIPWPTEFGGRALRNDFTEQWAQDGEGLVDALAKDPSITETIKAARTHADVSTAPVYAGQSVSRTAGQEGAADIVAELAGFRTHLGTAAARWSRGR
ncbi:MAG: nitronate monooxygenase [Micrococcaceae bacterium]|uniref:NAD(P)H-dependent flavin oxidoreductase n=1 Tax=Arthrobacter sp. 179 TaxID=3457734 RepID=UPI0026519887|nr:nitronate monooxygenase [Micrococcaceae bacterium]MDN6332951.1 nitronate monooxygenase [Micrococcaceae bacterium]